MQYYRWIEVSVKNYENYVMQRNLGVQVVKNCKGSTITVDAFAEVAEEIRAL